MVSASLKGGGQWLLPVVLVLAVGVAGLESADEDGESGQAAGAKARVCQAINASLAHYRWVVFAPGAGNAGCCPGCLATVLTS